jgi:hypothetical protein
MTRSASDPQDVALDEAEATWLAWRDTLDMEWVLGDPRGRRLIHKLMTTCGIYSQIHVGSSQVYVGLGKREVGLALREMVKSVNVGLLPLMESEYDARPRKFDIPEGKGDPVDERDAL